MSENVQTADIDRSNLLSRLVTPWTVIILAPIMVALLDPANFQMVSVFAIKAFASTLPYIGFAVLLIAWLKAAGAESAIAGAFRGHENRMIVLAALFGGLAPFCSCQVIPFIAGLLAVGVPLAPVMAFWLSSPLIDPPTLLITAGALGWSFAIAKAVTAVALGLAGGFVIKLLVVRGFFAEPALPRSSGGCCKQQNPMNGAPVWQFWQETGRREIFRREGIGNAQFLVKWLALAYVLEALLVTYIPADLIANAVGGNGVMPIIISAFIGIPAYLNSYLAPPLLAGLVEQGMSLGAAMSFMVAGAVSSVPAMAAVWSIVKRGVFVAYIGLGLMGAVLSGLIFQIIA